MSGRGDKRRKQKKNKRRARRGPAPDTLQTSDLPRPLRLLVERFEEVDDRFVDGREAEEVLAEIERDIDLLAHEIVALSAPIDLSTLLDTVSRFEARINHETYRETEHEGQLAAVELLALLVATRGSRLPVTESEGEGGRAIQMILNKLHALTRLGGTHIVLRITAEHGRAGELSIGPLLREVFVRNLSFPHMLRDTLDQLFDDVDLEQRLEDVLGFTYADVTATFESLERLLNEDEEQRMDLFRSRFEAAIADAQTAGPDALAAALDNALLGDTPKLITAERITGRSGPVLDRTKAVLSAFSTRIDSALEPSSVVRSFFSGQSTLKFRPLLEYDSGEYQLPHGALHLAAVRGNIEQALKPNQSAWDLYSKRRGDFLEEAALSLLQQSLPLAEVRRSEKFFFPAKGREDLETEPSEFTGLAETDGLILVDDVALIVEAKSNKLSPLARSGDKRKVKQDLEKIISKGNEQANRLRQRIVDDGGIRLRDDEWLDLSFVREIHTVVVSLEDLSGYAPITGALIDEGLLSEETIPWIVSLHDLRVVSELLDRPSELLLYIRRRTQLEVTRWIRSQDELDYFMHFLDQGLYIEPDPDTRYKELPELGPPSKAEKKRRREMAPTLLLSQTDAIDGWYFHMLGLRGEPVQKPVVRTTPAISNLVDSLEDSARPGSLRTGAFLLGLSTNFQEEIPRYVKQIMQMVQQDGEPHTITICSGTSKSDSVVLLLAAVPESSPKRQYLEYLQRYLAAKRYQLGVAVGVGFLYADSDSDQPVAFLYENSLATEDPEMDQLVNEIGLKSFREE